MGDPRYIWTWGILLLMVLAALSCVRNIAKFSFTFLFANVTMFSVAVCILAFSLTHLF